MFAKSIWNNYHREDHCTAAGQNQPTPVTSTSPTYADMINKTKNLAFINEALSGLSSYKGIRIPATSNKKLSHFQGRKGNDTPYKHPCTYKECLERQRSMHRAGVKQAQDFIRRYLPDEFETTLTVNGCWKCLTDLTSLLRPL